MSNFKVIDGLTKRVVKEFTSASWAFTWCDQLNDMVSHTQYYVRDEGAERKVDEIMRKSGIEARNAALEVGE